MKRTAWLVIFGISVTVLQLLVLFTFGLYAVANVGAVLFRLVFILAEDLEVSTITFGKFISNFVGSPLFYIYLADLAVLIGSAVALIVTKKRR